MHGMWSVADITRHCESGECSRHGAEWDRIKRRIVDLAYADRERVREAAIALGLVPRQIRVVRGPHDGNGSSPAPADAERNARKVARRTRLHEAAGDIPAE